MSVKGFLLDRIGPRVAQRMPRRSAPSPSLWGLDSNNGVLSLDGVELRSLTERFGSPLHVVDMAALRRLAQSVSLSDGVLFTDRRSTAVSGVLDELHRAGIGISVNGVHELETTLRAGVEGAAILWSDPAPTPAALATACDAHVGIVCVPSSGALETLLTKAPASTRVGLLAPLGSDGIDDMTGGHGSIAEAFGLCRDAGRDAMVLRFELSGEISSRSDLEAACSQLRGAAQSIEQQRRQSESAESMEVHAVVVTDVLPPTVTSTGTVGKRLNRALAVDLPAPDLEASVTLGETTTAFEKTLRAALEPTTQVSIEPGSALVASTQMTLSTVLDAKRDGRTEHVVLDAGMNLAAGTATHLHELFNASAHQAALPDDTPFRFVGPICTPADVTYTNWRLASVDIGDVVAIMDTGAGFVASSTSFSFPQPAVVAISGGDAALLREAESFARLTELDEPNSYRSNGAVK